jgi:hypothetical protein
VDAGVDFCPLAGALLPSPMNPTPPLLHRPESGGQDHGHAAHPPSSSSPPQPRSSPSSSSSRTRQPSRRHSSCTAATAPGQVRLQLLKFASRPAVSSQFGGAHHISKSSTSHQLGKIRNPLKRTFFLRVGRGHAALRVSISPWTFCWKRSTPVISLLSTWAKPKATPTARARCRWAESRLDLGCPKGVMARTAPAKSLAQEVQSHNL